MSLLPPPLKRFMKEKSLAGFKAGVSSGPRALGNRSILCRPSPKNMKTKVNIIKV